MDSWEKVLGSIPTPWIFQTMPKNQPKKPVPKCVACGGTGKSTSGKKCEPCLKAGRIK